MRRVRVALVLAAVALGLAAEQATHQPGELTAAVADLIVGWSLLGCGLVAWQQRRESRVGPLLAGAGAAWVVGDFATAALDLHRGPLIHAVLAYPSGRVQGRAQRVGVFAVSLDGALGPIAGRPAVTLGLSAVVAGSAIHGYLAPV